MLEHARTCWNMAGPALLAYQRHARKLLQTPAQHPAVSLNQNQAAFSFDEQGHRSQAGETQPQEPTAWVPLPPSAAGCEWLPSAAACKAIVKASLLHSWATGEVFLPGVVITGAHSPEAEMNKRLIMGYRSSLITLQAPATAANRIPDRCAQVWRRWGCKQVWRI